MEDEKEYHKLDEDELVKEAKRIREIENLEERVEKGHQLVTGYKSSPKVGLKYLKRSLDVDVAELDKLAKKAHEKIDKKSEDGKFLNYDEQMEIFRDLANLVGPHMYIGTKDAKSDSEEWEKNWQHLDFYLSNIEVREKVTAMDAVRDALRGGDVHKAKQLIVDALKEHYKKTDFSNFMKELIPPDDRDYHLELAGEVAKKYNRELREAGIDKKVTKATVAQNIFDVYDERANLAIGIKKKYEASDKDKNTE